MCRGGSGTGGGLEPSVPLFAGGVFPIFHRDNGDAVVIAARSNTFSVKGKYFICNVNYRKSEIFAECRKDRKDRSFARRMPPAIPPGNDLTCRKMT